MSARNFGCTIDFGGLGAGEVVRDLPVEDLIGPEPRVNAPRSPRSYNLRMYEGALRPRPGYSTFANTPRSNPILALVLAQFANDSQDFLRFDRSHVARLTGATWTDILGTLTGADSDWFTFAHLPRVGGAPVGNELFFCNGVDNVYGYEGGASAPTAVGAAYFTAARAIVGHTRRALIMNVLESGTRYQQRIWYSILGDPRTYIGTGSGFVDLADDPWPIVNGLIIGGRVCVFKGNSIGGAIVVGTLTGNPNAPYRWDTLATRNESMTSVGLLFPRTLIAVSGDVAFFVGHDGFYLYDGARALQQVATSVSRDILSRVNKSALHAGFAWYKNDTSELFLHLPTGASTVANEVWVIALAQRRVYGPFAYATDITAIGMQADTGTLQWDDLSTLTWDTLPPTYPTWDSLRGSAQSARFIFGGSNGATFEHNDTVLTDAGATVQCEYLTGAIRAEGRVITTIGGGQKLLRADDVLVLQDVVLHSLNRGAWTPAISISVNGGTSFTAISDGTTMGDATNLGRSQAKHYTCSIPGTWFQIKIAGAEPMTPFALRLEFSYAGNDRHS